MRAFESIDGSMFMDVVRIHTFDYVAVIRQGPGMSVLWEIW